MVISIYFGDKPKSRLGSTRQPSPPHPQESHSGSGSGLGIHSPRLAVRWGSSSTRSRSLLLLLPPYPSRPLALSGFSTWWPHPDFSHGRQRLPDPTSQVSSCTASNTDPALFSYGFKPRVRLCADSSEPGTCFRFCVSLCLGPSPARALSLPLSPSLSLKNKR